MNKTTTVPTPTPAPAPLCDFAAASAPFGATPSERRLAFGESFIGAAGVVPFELNNDQQSTVLNVALGYIANAVKHGRIPLRCAKVVREAFAAGVAHATKPRRA